MNTSKNRYLKCIRAVPGTPDLKVGDLLWQVTREIWPGGYEMMVCNRRGDGAVIKFRVDHLDECFEIVEVDDLWPRGWRCV